MLRIASRWVVLDVGGVLLPDQSERTTPLDSAPSLALAADSVARRDRLAALDGAEDLLIALRRVGFSLAVLSNVARECDQAHLVPQIFRRIDRCFQSYAIGWKKPALQAFHLVQRALGVPPRNICMVGDRFAADIQPALQSGWSAVLLDRGSDSAGSAKPEIPRMRRASSPVEVFTAIRVLLSD